MKMRRVAALMAAALVVGVVAGNVATGVAAPTADTTTGTVTGLGLHLGAVVRDAGGRIADVVAGLTGLSAEEVHDQREAGASFSAIAKSKGVDSTAVVAKALKIRTEVLEKKVADGTITQDQADAAVTRMTTRVTERVEATGEPVRGGMGGGQGARDGSGADGGQGKRDGSGAGGGKGQGAGGGRNGGTCTQTPADTQ
ncbi:MAG: hypothetical protein U1E26_08400 [Coriobacteriia bacterium]|nr:hypothetical protein [Coriobacteriia bacterium]